MELTGNSLLQFPVVVGKAGLQPGSIALSGGLCFRNGRCTPEALSRDTQRRDIAGNCTANAFRARFCFVSQLSAQFNPADP